MAIITVTSPDIPIPGSLIPPLHKGSLCLQGNVNPAFNWTLTGFNQGHIDTYDIYMIDNSATGTGPGNKFLHWKVTQLNNTYLSLDQDQIWTTEVIFPTDYGSGDNVNGYNGPCAPTATNNLYQMLIVANIRQDSQQFVGAHTVTGTYRFTDNSNNLGGPTTGDCVEDSGQIFGSVKCCYLIENCIDSSETYYIEMLKNPVQNVYQDHVYTFGGDADLFQNKCFKLLSLEICPDSGPDIDDVTIVTDHGLDNCIACSPSEQFKSCSTNELVYVSVLNTPPLPGECEPTLWEITIPGQAGSGGNSYSWLTCTDQFGGVGFVPNGGETTPPDTVIQVCGNSTPPTTTSPGATIVNLGPCPENLILNNVYTLSAYDNDCYTYVGTVNNQSPEQSTNVTSLDTEDCLICDPCHVFTSCIDDTEIRIRFEEGVEIPTINQIVNLGGNEAIEDICWQYTGTDTCDGDEDYLDVIVTTNYECDDCRICNPNYLLTDCEDSENTLIIEWDQADTPLDPELTYIFDFDPVTCWTSLARPPLLCNEIIPPEPCDCFTYTGAVNNGAPGIIPYIDCDGLATEYVYPGTFGEWDAFTFCGPPDQTLVPSADKGFEYKETSCCEFICVNYTLTFLAGSPGYVYSWLDCSGIAQSVTYPAVSTEYTEVICAREGTLYTRPINGPTVVEGSECVDPPPLTWQSEACVIGFMDKLSWIEDSSDVVMFNQSLDSLIINGVEYVVPGNEPTWLEDKQSPNGLSSLTTVSANNLYGVTYLEQVNGMNAAFATLGIDELIKAQVVTNDYWVGTALDNGNINDQQGGLYLILREDVLTISMELNDDAGFVRSFFRDALGVWTVGSTQGSATDVSPGGLLGYEFVTCTDTVLNEPFPVIDGVVIEAPFDPQPPCESTLWEITIPGAAVYPFGNYSYFQCDGPEVFVSVAGTVGVTVVEVCSRSITPPNVSPGGTVVNLGPCIP
jgi:phosphatidylethanolamine-binding protein (PEBP) family uncharacterized protein